MMKTSCVMAKTAGNGINREDQIHHVDQKQNERERREHEFAVHARREMFVAKFVRHVDRSAAEPHQPVVGKILFFLFAEEHADGGDEKENAEKVENEMESCDQRDA